MEPPRPSDDGLFIDVAFYAMALVAVMIMISASYGGRTSMEARQEPAVIYGPFRAVTDTNGQIEAMIPAGPQVPCHSGWWLTLQLSWDALFHRKGPCE